MLGPLGILRRRLSKQYNRIDEVRGEEVATYAVDVPGAPMQRKVRDAIALWNKRSLQEQDGGMATSTSTSILPTIPELSTPLQSQPTQLNSVNVHLSRKELKLKFGLQFTEVKSDGSRLKLCLKSITPNSLADDSGELWAGQEVYRINRQLCATMSMKLRAKILTTSHVIVLEVEGPRGPSLADLPLDYIFAHFGLTPADLCRLSGVCHSLCDAAGKVTSLYAMAEAVIESGELDLLGALQGTTPSPWFPVVPSGSTAQKRWSTVLPIGVIVAPGQKFAPDWSVIAVVGGDEVEAETRRAMEKSGDVLHVGPTESISRAWYGDPGHLWDPLHGKDVSIAARAFANEKPGRSTLLKASNEIWDDPCVGIVKVLVVELGQLTPHELIAKAITSGSRFRSVALPDSSVTNVSMCLGAESISLCECEDVCDVSPLAGAHTVHLRFCTALIDVTPLARVHTLDLRGCSGLRDVSSLGNVNKLCLADCENVTDVSKLGGVLHLDLHRCSGVEDVRALSECHTLILAGCRNVRDVSMLGRVHHLDISCCIGVREFSALTAVHSLCARGTLIDDVSTLGNVRHLDLSHCRYLTDVSALSSAVSLDLRESGVTVIHPVASVPGLTATAAFYQALGPCHVDGGALSGHQPPHTEPIVPNAIGPCKV